MPGPNYTVAFIYLCGVSPPLTCSADGAKLLVNFVSETSPKFLTGPPLVHQDLSMCFDCPVKNQDL